ncbi:MAG: hypothetical protein LBI58_01420, partial [Tannerellaceae bacterium]|nr:hypothetical protein [Tannerellaceae bacterium]
MKTLGNLFLLFVIASILLPAKLYAQNTNFTLGGQYNYTGNSRPVLDIRVNANGTWQIYRKVGSSYQYQLTNSTPDIFAIKIDNTVFYTYTDPGSGTRFKLTSSDVVAPVNSETVQVEQATKRYSPPSSYTGATFYVDLTFWYDKNNPGSFTITAYIHAESIPSTTNISLAYGFDTRVNGNYTSAAITFPDIKGYNDSDVDTNRTFTTAEVQSLDTVGCVNNSGDGSLLAFFTMGGRQFDRAYSANYANARASSYINYTTNAGVFNYGVEVDNGIAVAYDNISGGALRTISTGLTFTADATLFPEIPSTNTNFVLGGRYNYTGNGKPVLDIRVNANGMWTIYRKVGGSYAKQFYDPYDIFAIKISNTVFYTNTDPGSGTRFKLTSSNVVVPTNSETVPVEQATKRYSGSYNSHKFYVDLTFRYDKNNPDYFTITADIHAENIPSNVGISFVYGFDTFVNGDDRSAAITFPDIRNFNGSGTNADQAFTTAEVQSLYMVGCINNAGAGSLMALFTMGGRSFDRAYSAKYNSPANVMPSKYINYTNNYFNYYMSIDNGLAVAYDNIPGGALRTISTGLTFTSNIPAGLTYALQQDAYFSTIPSQHITVPFNQSQAAPVTLRLSAGNGYSDPITGVGFQVNMPTFPPGLTVTGAQTSQNFTATHDHDDDYYNATGGTIAANTTGNILVPLSAASYGEWTIDYPNFSDMSNIMPMGSVPAVFTVTTEANYLSTTSASVAAGGSKTFTVKLPPGLTAHRDIVV